MSRIVRSADTRLEVLLAETARGNRDSFARLYDLTSARLFAVVRRILPAAELAEDALQETYVKIWQRAGRFQAELGPAMAWMTAIARNQAIDLRRRSMDRLGTVSEPIGETAMSQDIGPEAQAELTGSLQRLKSCLQALPGDRQEMIVLAYHQGWSREELAARFQRPVATIKTILRRSLMTLRECLDAA
jgi:RNA polymerase sigma-70 factor (ECF subfamily)